MFITLKSNLLFFSNYLYIVIYTYSNLQKKKENKCTLLIYVHMDLKERRKVSGDGSPLPSPFRLTPTSICCIIILVFDGYAPW